MDLSIEPVPAATREIAELLGELDRDLSGPYLPSQRHALSLDQLFGPSVRFFAAYAGGDVVGCGGIALYDAFAEVKRMFTRPAYRRLGVALALLSHLEAEAKRAGYTTLRLETGCYQTAAMAFYERAGFRVCAAFGEYAAMQPATITTSVFYEKTL